jgi:uncharacterized protein (TIGR03437 family)
MSSQTVVRFLFFGLLATPLFAQPQIGGGTCNSATLKGTYALSFSGRQLSTAGAFSNVVQQNGTMTFDGLSGVVITFTGVPGVKAPLPQPGTYSVEANCTAVVNTDLVSSAILNLAIHDQGKDFQLTGFDYVYSYSGSGVALPPSTTCSTATLNGVYAFSGSGYGITSNAVTGAWNGAGLLQFDGEGNLMVTLAVDGTNSSAGFATGSYTISSNCLGSATLDTSTPSTSDAITFSIYSVAPANTNFYVDLQDTMFGMGGVFAGPSSALMAGAGHTANGQPAAANPQVATHAGSDSTAAGTCSTSDLNGVYPLTLSGRAISGAGNFTGAFQGIGRATFNGRGDVTLAGTANTNLAQGQPFSYKGTYSVPSNCYGTLTVTTASTATFTLVVWGGGGDFDIEGSDATYVYSGSGSDIRPPACATPTLSGEYTFTANGVTLSGTTISAVQAETGVLQFDGQGNVTAASYTDTQGGRNTAPGTTVSYNASGTYAVTSGCKASATLTDSSGNLNALNFVISGAYGQDLDLLAANSGFIRSGSAHSAFPNPSEDISNVDSYAYSATPAGSIFVLFGQDFATRPEPVVTLPLPNHLGSTSVTVNGEPAPLFYVSSDQIDAQMPWDIQGNTVASVIVTNGTVASNAAAVYVPATGTPGIGSYANNRAPVVNPDGSVNSASAPASVGDEVTVYFTGGGPVQASGPLTSGAAAPAGTSPVTGDNSITVGAVPAVVKYMGLSPGSVGLYQANFIVPAIAKGTYPLVITIAGYPSNNPVMTVSN